MSNRINPPPDTVRMRLNALASAPISWTAHGLSFSQDEKSGADVRLTFESAPERLDRPSARMAHRDTSPSDFLLRLTPDQRVRATSGRVITIDAPPDADQGDLARWVEGPAMAAILYQRGILPLHASAVLADGVLIAFLAPSGTGKSSLAAAFVAEGATLFADDLLAVWPDTEGAPRAFPGSSHLRIPPVTWATLDPTPFSVLREDSDGKRVAVVSAAPCTDSRPLAAIFLLETGASVNASPLSGFELLRRLRHLITRPSLPRPLGVELAVFTALGRITERVPAWRLTRPITEWTLSASQTLVRRCLTALSVTSPPSEVQFHGTPTR